MALSNRGCVQSRKMNVARCNMGKVGMKRTKNICKHSSKNTDVMEVASTAAVTLVDYMNMSNEVMTHLAEELTKLVTILLTSCKAR